MGSLIDVLLMPFYYRFNILLQHYRKAEFIPSDTKAYPWAPRLQRWATAVEARESFKQSIPSKDVVINAYTGYAGDRAFPSHLANEWADKHQIRSKKKSVLMFSI